jgi:hypothetical protein
MTVYAVYLPTADCDKNLYRGAAVHRVGPVFLHERHAVKCLRDMRKLFRTRGGEVRKEELN